MATLTYCKGLPTPVLELNALGFTDLEMFLASFAPIFHKAACQTVSHLLSSDSFNKSSWNTHLQQTYGISKRHANGVISFARGAVDSSFECRENHIKILTGKLKSIEKWIAKAENKLKKAAKFYRKKNWYQSKSGCVFPKSCSLQYRDTNWHNLRFQLHNKKRRRYQLIKQIEHLRSASIRDKVPRNQIFIVGSKDESFCNQTCQWDGDILKFRDTVEFLLDFSRFFQAAITGVFQPI
jgi:hypothetical protein